MSVYTGAKRGSEHDEMKCQWLASHRARKLHSEVTIISLILGFKSEIRSLGCATQEFKHFFRILMYRMRMVLEIDIGSRAIKFIIGKANYTRFLKAIGHTVLNICLL